MAETPKARRHAELQTRFLGGAKLTCGQIAERYGVSLRTAKRDLTDLRDMGLVLRHLVRNNGWVMQRYAPRHRLAEEIEEVINRYGRIARRENAMEGYRRGRRELAATIDEQLRQPMRQELFDCFTGLAHVRETLSSSPYVSEETAVAVVDEGKHAWAVHQALAELGVEEVNERHADAIVIGTLSPGPMLDAWERHRGGRGGGGPSVILPWIPRGLTAAEYATVASD